MRYNSVAAIVAAEFTASFKLRSRLVQLTPRAFHLLSRHRSFSSTAQRPLQSTASRCAQPVEDVLSGEPTAVQDDENSGVRSKRRVSNDKAPEERPTRLHNLFIDLMRTVPHPVAVVTARKEDVQDQDDVQGTVAATVSSFNTVSVHPDLIVSFNLKSDSTTHRIMLESKQFTVTFAQTNDAGANLVHSFTKGNEPSPFTAQFPNHPTPRPFTWPIGTSPEIKYATPAVCLTDSDDPDSGFAFALACEHQTSTPVADHVIVTGRVHGFIKIVGTGWGSTSTATVMVTNQVALSHVHGKYSSSPNSDISELLKNDDITSDPKSDDRTLKAKIKWCELRLKVLAGAQMVQKGVEIHDVYGPPRRQSGYRLTERTSKVDSGLLEEYERYYMQRVQYLKYQESRLSQSDVPGESDSDLDVAPEVDYANLTGYQQLFVRNKMLLTMDELDEEIALYSMRLSALRIEAKGDPEARALIEEDEPAEDLAPEELRSSLDLQPEEDGLTRNMQLRTYFSGRVFLLQHAKTRKNEFSKVGDEIVLTGEEKLQNTKLQDDKHVQAMHPRWMGANKSQPIETLKTKYRRYHHQVSEARLTLIGLEDLLEHPYLPILRDRIKYFEPRLRGVEQILKERVKNTTDKEVLVDSFKLPTMSRPLTEEDEEAAMGPMYKLKHLRTQNFKPIDPKLIRRQLAPEVRRCRSKEGDSIDQLDDAIDEDLRMERDKQTRNAVNQASRRLPVGKLPLVQMNAARHVKLETGYVSPEKEAAEDLKRMEEMDKNLLRDNASQVRDYLVLQSAEGEEMPSPADFVDVRKLREERLRREEEEGTAS